MRIRSFLPSTLLAAFFICSSFQPVSNEKEKFRPGYYLNGMEKVEGYINFEYDAYDKFYFKKELADKKTTKYVTECTGFSVDGKTFCVLEKLQLKIGIWKVSADKAFAEVVEEGSLNLYKVYSMVGSSDMRQLGADQVVNYFIERGKSKKYLPVPGARGKFRDEMMDFFQDRIDIAEKIDDMSYNINNIDQIVKDYNSKPCDTCRAR